MTSLALGAVISARILGCLIWHCLGRVTVLSTR